MGGAGGNGANGGKGAASATTSGGAGGNGGDAGNGGDGGLAGPSGNGGSGGAGGNGGNGRNGGNGSGGAVGGNGGFAGASGSGGVGQDGGPDSGDGGTGGSGGKGGNGRSGRLTLERAHQMLLDAVASLRRLITDSYPPDLDADGLPHALTDLASVTETPDLTVMVDVGTNGSLRGDAARLAYRVAREGLRNVARHANANTALVRVRLEGREAVVEVQDDGVGMPPGDVPEGHLGLRLLADTIRDIGGSMRTLRADGGGTLLEARYPTDNL